MKVLLLPLLCLILSLATGCETGTVTTDPTTTQPSRTGNMVDAVFVNDTAVRGSGGIVTLKRNQTVSLRVTTRTGIQLVEATWRVSHGTLQNANQDQATWTAPNTITMEPIDVTIRVIQDGRYNADTFRVNARLR